MFLKQLDSSPVLRTQLNASATNTINAEDN